MRDKQKTLVWPFVAALVVAGVLAYPLTLGPYCCWFAKGPYHWVGSRPAPKMAPRMYWPIGWLATNGPRPVHDAIFWYATPRGGRVLLPFEFSGRELIGRGGGRPVVSVM